VSHDGKQREEMEAGAGGEASRLKGKVELEKWTGFFVKSASE
jgi:hypothetical protein